MGTSSDTDPITELLTDLRDVLAATDAQIIGSTEIVENLTAREDRPWATWRRDKPISPHALARLLGPLGIYPVRLEQMRGYRRDGIADAIRRYVAALPSERQEPSKRGGNPHDTSVSPTTAQETDRQAVSTVLARVPDGLTHAQTDSQADGLF